MLSNILGTWLNSVETGKSKQSPINIDPALAVHRKSLIESEIVLNYDSKCFEEIKNNGHTFVISGSSKKGFVTGGPLKEHRYQFLQFHMHWGQSNDHGSEHLINGKQYSAEVCF